MHTLQRTHLPRRMPPRPHTHNRGGSHLLGLCENAPSGPDGKQRARLSAPHHPTPLSLQYGLSASLLRAQLRYQAKNVSGLDSRLEGTKACTSTSEPADRGIYSSGQVNTAALWNTPTPTISSSKLQSFYPNQS